MSFFLVLCANFSFWPVCLLFQRIKHQILREYRDNLRDSKYRETKRRFQHLHEKLAYIKQLVLEWDMAQTCRS